MEKETVEINLREKELETKYFGQLKLLVEIKWQYGQLLKSLSMQAL